jgi:hypothetical protein
VLASDSLYTDELLGRKISDESIVGLRLLLVRLRVMVVSNHLFTEFYYYSMNEQRKMKIFLKAYMHRAAMSMWFSFPKLEFLPLYMYFSPVNSISTRIVY